MVGAHQNFNGSRDLTTPISGMINIYLFCHSWAGTLATINLRTKFEVSIDSHYADIKGDIKYQKWDGLG